ncbi:MAG: EAL domain-containing protein [Pseudomonadales bacterium]|nr:EAL domain-containing protein [Pseudomonadales bacterium]
MNITPVNNDALKLLVIDDDVAVSDLIESISRDMKFAVNCVYDYESIGSTYRSFQPDVIFLDLMLPGYDGVEVLHYFAEVGCKAKIILISGVDKTTLASAGEVGRLSNLNIVGTLKKPFLIEDVEKTLLNEADSTCCFSSTAFQNLFGAGEFRILGQPCMEIKSMAGKEMSDVDISVNWYGQAGKSFILSDQFLPMLSAVDMASEFDHTMLEMTFGLFRSWMDRGMEFGLVIRLDDSLFLDGGLSSYLLNLSKKWEIPSNRLTFGISESVVSSKSVMVLDVLTRLRINGFNISAEIRNPETSELERLLHLPVNELRLCASLIQSISKSVEAEFNVSTLISICDKQGLATRAEGVENEATMKFLYSCGCTSGLGRFFSEPLKLHELENFVSNPKKPEELSMHAVS